MTGEREVSIVSLIERDELIARLIEADRALFDSGDTVSHRQSAETALRVVEDYIDQQLRGAVEALTPYLFHASSNCTPSGTDIEDRCVCGLSAAVRRFREKQAA